MGDAAQAGSLRCLRELRLRDGQEAVLALARPAASIRPEPRGNATTAECAASSSAPPPSANSTADDAGGDGCGQGWVMGLQALCPLLHTLDLRGCHPPNKILAPCSADAGSDQGLSAAAASPALRQLCGGWMLRASTSRLPTWLASQLGRLHTLRLGLGAPITDCSLEVLSGCEGVRHHLRTLDLSFGTFGSAGLRAVAKCEALCALRSDLYSYPASQPASHYVAMFGLSSRLPIDRERLRLRLRWMCPGSRSTQHHSLAMAQLLRSRSCSFRLGRHCGSLRWGLHCRRQRCVHWETRWHHHHRHRHRQPLPHRHRRSDRIAVWAARRCWLDSSCR